MRILRGDGLKKRLLAYGTCGCILISAGLALAGEFDTILAWWFAIALLYTPLAWAFKTHSIALITICSLAFVTQFITLPVFFLSRDSFAWGHVKPFGFTAFEALPMLLKVTAFLLILIVFFKLFYKISFIGGSSRNIKNQRYAFSALFVKSMNQFKITSSNSRQNTTLFFFAIIFTVAALVPLNLWMFSQGISIVGIEPPRLPYRLSGILHYFTKYVAPLTLAYFYFKSNRGWLPMLLLLAYSIVLGASSVSRSSLMFVMLPVILLAWLDCRYLMSGVAAFGSLMGISFVSAARNIVYVTSAGKNSGNFDTGVFSMLVSIASNSSINIFDPVSIFKMFVGVFGRIDGFDNLVMSQYYDSYQVMGPFAIVKRMIWQGFAPIDLDLHHMQWQGNTLIDGFVNCGGLLSDVVIVGNASVFWIALSAIVVAATLVLLEKSTMRLAKIYNAPSLFSNAATGFLSMVCFIGSSGSVQYVYPFLLIFIASLLPPLFKVNPIKAHVVP